jgi:hypothetical protein
MPQYRVNVGIDYAGRRAEPGDLVDDIPTRSLKWLLEQNVIEEVTKTAPPVKTQSEPPKSPTPKSKGDDD